MTKHERPSDFGRPAQPGEPATQPCRVAELAMRFDQAAEVWDSLNDGDCEATNEAIMNALRDAAAFDQPMSPEGALFQVMIASAAMDSLHSHVSDDATVVAREHAVRLDCALWGVRRFLETHFGLDAATAGAAYLMPENVSYFGKLQAAAVAAKAEGVDNGAKNRRHLTETASRTGEAFRETRAVI